MNLLKALLDRFIPGKIAVSIYLILSAAVFIRPTKFPAWTHEGVISFFRSLAAMQGLQFFIMVLVTAVFLISKLNKEADPALNPRELRNAIRVIGFIGLAMSWGYIWLQIKKETDFSTLAGMALTSGYFLELIFRRISGDQSAAIIRGMLYSSVAGGVAGFFVLLTSTNFNSLVQMRHWSFVGIIYFGFRFFWERGLDRDIVEFMEEQRPSNKNKSA